MATELIAALEAAEGPEDEARVIERAWCVLRQNSTEDEDAHIAELLAMGAFLQVAMTLVPEGCHHDLLHASMQAVGKKYDLHMCLWPDSVSYPHQLAIALCIAALKAKETSDAS